MLSYQMPGFGLATMTVINDAPIHTVSYGLGQMIAWAFGCGVHRFEFEATKHRLGLSVFMNPLVEPQPLQAANCSLMGEMVRSKLIPNDIPVHELLNMDGNQSVVGDGQARFTFKTDEGGTLIQQYDCRPDISVATWAFAFSDHCAGFFWRGVKKIKIFHSMKLTQVHMTPALDRKLITNVMTNAEDYPQNATVSSIK